MIISEIENKSCPLHSGFKSDIDHLASSDRDQWDAISGLRNKLDKQTWLLVATLAGIITQLVLSTLRCIPFILLFACFAQAADVTLALNPNSTTDPAGYKLYIGTKSREYTIVVDLGPRERDVKFTIEVDLLPGKIYYVAATAYDASGNESSFSAEVDKAFYSPEPRITYISEPKQ